MINISLPYKIGTFVKVVKQDAEPIFGTISGYTVFNDSYTVWVSGYKEPWTGEYLPDMILPIAEEEILNQKICGISC